MWLLVSRPIAKIEKEYSTNSLYTEFGISSVTTDKISARRQDPFRSILLISSQIDGQQAVLFLVEFNKLIQTDELTGEFPANSYGVIGILA